MYLSSDPDVGVGVVVDRRLEKIILSHNAACPQNIVDHFNILPQNLATTSVQKVQQANRDIIISIGKPMGGHYRTIYINWTKSIQHSIPELRIGFPSAKKWF